MIVGHLSSSPTVATGGLVLDLWLKHEIGPGRVKVCFSAGVLAWLKHGMWLGKVKVCFSAGVQV